MHQPTTYWWPEHTKTRASEQERERAKGRLRNMGGWAIAVHGGAGVDPNLPLERQEEAKQLLTRCLNLGISALGSNLSAIDVVELVVRFFFIKFPFSFLLFLLIIFYTSHLKIKRRHRLPKCQFYPAFFSRNNQALQKCM